MTRRTIQLTDRLYEYLLSVSLREPDVLARLRAETASHPRAEMQISPEQGQFMRFLIGLIGARRTLELGVFTGYSALSAALAVPADGRVVACEIDPAFADVARRWWKEGGVDGKIDLRLGPAVETLDALLEDGQAGTFDFAFVDADKESYRAYYDRCLELVRRGGLILFDNTLWAWTGPIQGKRWLFALQQAVPISGDDISYGTVMADLRGYARRDRYVFAFRAMGASSFGGDPQRFFLGGPNTLRGWDVQQFGARNVALVSGEFRYPFLGAHRNPPGPARDSVRRGVDGEAEAVVDPDEEEGEPVGVGPPDDRLHAQPAPIGRLEVQVHLGAGREG